MADPVSDLITERSTGLIPGLIAPLAVGGVRTVVIDALVIAALVVLVITAVGMTIGGSVLTRLHFLAPAGTLALPLFGLAAMIDQGVTLGSTAIALAVAAGALSSPVLTTSIARLVVAESGDDSRDAVADDHRAEDQR